jgi:hypothetical protein
MCEHTPTPTPQIVYVTVLVTPTLQPTTTSPTLTTQGGNPSTGNYFRVTYPGTYTYQVPYRDSTAQGTSTGESLHKFDATKGIFWVSVQKNDDSSNKIIVEVYKNGTMIGQASNTDPRGTVDLLVDLQKAVLTTVKPFPSSTYEIGESATNGLVKVTVNSKRYADKLPAIGPGGVQEYVLSSRGQWEIVKVTVENIQKDGNVSADWNQFLFMDNREGTHTGTPSIESPDKFHVNLAPGQKVTGELAFQVTKNPIGVQLRYSYTGRSATFNI